MEDNRQVAPFWQIFWTLAGQGIGAEVDVDVDNVDVEIVVVGVETIEDFWDVVTIRGDVVNGVLVENKEISHWIPMNPWVHWPFII